MPNNPGAVSQQYCSKVRTSEYLTASENLPSVSTENIPSTSHHIRQPIDHPQLAQVALQDVRKPLNTTTHGSSGRVCAIIVSVSLPGALNWTIQSFWKITRHREVFVLGFVWLTSICLQTADCRRIFDRPAMEPWLCICCWYVYNALETISAFSLLCLRTRADRITRGEGSGHHRRWCGRLRCRHQGWTGGLEG